MDTSPMHPHDEPHAGTVSRYTPLRVTPCPCGAVMTSAFGVFICNTCGECKPDNAPYVERIASAASPTLEYKLSPSRAERLYVTVGFLLKLVGCAFAGCVVFLAVYGVIALFGRTSASTDMFSAAIVLCGILVLGFLVLLYLHRTLYSKI